jgi:hypothetical protein
MTDTRSILSFRRKPESRKNYGRVLRYKGLVVILMTLAESCTIKLKDSYKRHDDVPLNPLNWWNDTRISNNE